MKQNDCIMLPEYICDVILQPLESLGLRHSYYSVNDGFIPNWDELENLVDNQTKAILMQHFFGQPQDIAAFQSFCDHHGLLLIEDNAHGHGGAFNKKLLGSFGDMGISSPRKILNIHSGGVLWLRDLELKYIPNLQPYPASLRQHVRKNIINLYPTMKYSIKKLLKNRPKYEDPRASREAIISDYLIDKWSKEIIENTDWDELRKIRQQSYFQWQDFAQKNELIPVYKQLHPEANPWCFPAYAKDQQDTARWFDWGWDNNVHVFSWPSLEEKVLAKKGESLTRWQKLICFGIA